MRYRSYERRAKLIVNRPHGDEGRSCDAEPQSKLATIARNKIVGSAETREASNNYMKEGALTKSALKMHVWHSNAEWKMNRMRTRW